MAKLFTPESVVFDTVCSWHGVINVFGKVVTDKGTFNLHIIGDPKDFSTDTNAVKLLLEIVALGAEPVFPGAKSYTWERGEFSVRVSMYEDQDWWIKITVGEQ